MRARVRSKRKANKKTNWVLRILLISIAALLFLELVQLHVQIEEKQNQLNDLNAQIAHAQLVAEGLSEQKDNAEDILEREANEAGLYMPGQQIYQGAVG